MNKKFSEMISQLYEENKVMKTDIEHLKAKVNMLSFEIERSKRPVAKDSLLYWNKRLRDTREGTPEREHAQAMLSLAMYEMEHEEEEK